jgi:energy-coupling factor transporter transmembrane protein EcfT
LIRIHSANQIAVWLWVACLLQILQGTPLLVCSLASVLLALACCAERCWRTLKRTRYLLLAIVLIYGWATPGQYLWANSWAPTEEGLLRGGEQMLRLLGVLAALQVLLWRLSAAQMFSGLYTLFAPLTWLGFDRQCWALRLSLTMRFSAELLLSKDALTWHGFLQHLAEAEQPSDLRDVLILVESLSFFDLMLLLACVASMTLMMMV